MQYQSAKKELLSWLLELCGEGGSEGNLKGLTKDVGIEKNNLQGVGGNCPPVMKVGPPLPL